MEREEAERAELRKIILGQSEKKPQINQNDQQQSSNQGIVLFTNFVTKVMKYMCFLRFLIIDI